MSGVSERVAESRTSELRLLYENGLADVGLPGTMMIFEQKISRSTDTYLGTEQRLARKLYARTYWGSSRSVDTPTWAAYGFDEGSMGLTDHRLMSLIGGAAQRLGRLVRRSYSRRCSHRGGGWSALEADTTPILRLQPGGPLDSGDMRSDVALLVRGRLCSRRPWSRKPLELKPHPSA